MGRLKGGKNKTHAEKPGPEPWRVFPCQSMDHMRRYSRKTKTRIIVVSNRPKSVQQNKTNLIYQRKLDAINKEVGNCIMCSKRPTGTLSTVRCDDCHTKISLRQRWRKLLVRIARDGYRSSSESPACAHRVSA